MSVTESPTIAVCVRYTLDVEQIKPDPASGEPLLARVAHRINTFDENGIEAALRLRDEHGGRVLGVSVVDERPPENVLFQGLAMGLDEIHLVTGAAAGDALATAEALAAAIRRLGPVDLVICSDTSADEYRGEVGPRLAAALALPCVTYVTRLSLEDGRVRADRTLESVVEIVEAQLPALVSVGSETNDPRMPTLRHIGQARTKPIVESSLAELPGVGDAFASGSGRIATLAIKAPPNERKRVRVDGDTQPETARALLDHLLSDGAVRF
jgi:electron transfer flavoprotein beta subunit